MDHSDSTGSFGRLDEEEWSSSRFKVVGHELEVNVPVGRHGAMPACMHVIAEGIADELSRLREFIRGRAFLSESSKTGRAAMAARNSPLGSDQLSVLPVWSSTGRGP